VTAGTEPTTAKGSRDASPSAIYYGLFFISGIPALLYQIVWQRALFTIYGVNIESVTIIVTVFMLGLGLGSLAGGGLSKRTGLRLLRVFGLIELGIGMFGAVSLSLFHSAAFFTAGASTLKTGIVTFVLLLFPTLLMGSTLPLLVAYFVRRTGNVGESVGVLYSANTFGSAVACFAAAGFIMRFLGETGSVRLAALINTGVALTALVLDARAPSQNATAVNRPQTETPREMEVVSFGLGLVLSAAVGFIALAYEIIWYRLYSFASGGAAPCFALLLGWYLAGIAYGSLNVRDLCRKKLAHDLPRTLGLAATLVVWGNIAGFLVGPVLGRSAAYVAYTTTLPLVFIGASLLGAAFPLLSHAAISPRQKAGSRVSYLYLANIVGSASGSFLVGFVWMDHWSTYRISLALLALSVGIALLMLLAARPMASLRPLAAGLVACVVVTFLSGRFFSGMYERMFFKSDYHPAVNFQYLVENRNGVIGVDRSGMVVGGGAYDGHFNTSLVHDSNGIFRAYAILGVHPAPKQVLMIGLSSGSWAQVIASDNRVERLTIVEINPGYLTLIRRFPDVASLLRNPKVELVINDGRRWLVQNPNRKFDLLVMNTTFHWRAHVSNLLSVEFLRLVRSHLNPGGIHYFNTTSSGEAQLTGATQFRHCLRVHNFLAAGDTPLSLDKQRWETLLRGFAIDGKPVFDLSDALDRRRLDEVLMLAEVSQLGDDGAALVENEESLRRRLKGKRLITDDNMGTEWN
jgi:predicted membrane-bound spermidine synthase